MPRCTNWPAIWAGSCPARCRGCWNRPFPLTMPAGRGASGCARTRQVKPACHSCCSPCVTIIACCWPSPFVRRATRTCPARPAAFWPLPVRCPSSCSSSTARARCSMPSVPAGWHASTIRCRPSAVPCLTSCRVRPETSCAKSCAGPRARGRRFVMPSTCPTKGASPARWSAVPSGSSPAAASRTGMAWWPSSPATSPRSGAATRNCARNARC